MFFGKEAYARAFGVRAQKVPEAPEPSNVGHDELPTTTGVDQMAGSGGDPGTQPDDAMLHFTERAREIVQAYLDQSSGELEALRISAHSGSPVAPRFELTLVSLSEREAEERELEGPGFPLLVRSSDVERLTGAGVDFVERVNESGFEVRLARSEAMPPNGGAAPPTGEIAERVRSVLDGQVNPAIAAHGGMIDLVDVQDTEVFVRMSGGCQGCALSRMTLRQGVEKMLRQAIPELTAVHDVTDHASGENPFFQH